ncbi:MAG: helix-turn-helix transcriptional regulator [Candidatus Brocadiales bacterium]
MSAKKSKRTFLQSKMGRRLRQLRKHAGWTQEEVATRARMDWKDYGMIERGELNVTLNTLEKLGGALRVEAYKILLFSTEGEVADCPDDKDPNVEKFLDILENVNEETKKKILSIAQMVISDE